MSAIRLGDPDLSHFAQADRRLARRSGSSSGSGGEAAASAARAALRAALKTQRKFLQGLCWTAVGRSSIAGRVALGWYVPGA